MISMNLRKLTKIKYKQIDLNTIISYPYIKELCRRPYSNYDKCRNVNKCNNLNIPDFKNLNKKGNYKFYYLIYAKFYYFKYWILRLFEAIKSKTLDYWTTQRLNSLIYWQGVIKSYLKEFINNLFFRGDFYIFGCGSVMSFRQQKIAGSMENSCINVFSTMKLNKIKMDIKPVNKIYLVCLICSEYKIDFNNDDGGLL